MNSRARLIALCIVSASCALVASCWRPPTPHFVEPDAGPIDTGPGPGVDTDGDGLCDRTEISIGSDPTSIDTDGDGFSDYVEEQNGSSFLSLSTPDRTTMVFMSEAPDATLSMPAPFVVRGIGETFSGELTRFPPAFADDGAVAQTFYAGTVAVGASPMENVRGGISGPSFLGVVGRTLLSFEVRFQQAQSARGCMRAYPFGYVVKTGDGALRGSISRWLVITPPGMTIGGAGARWCGPATASCF